MVDFMGRPFARDHKPDDLMGFVVAPIDVNLNATIFADAACNTSGNLASAPMFAGQLSSFRAVLKKVMQAEPKWAQLAAHQKETLEMIAHKIGRILNGDPNYHDSWHDIVGYAKLTADELLLKPGSPKSPRGKA